MLSIGTMASGQASYYLSLAREDYYLDGGEPPGRWHGQGAAALGLGGVVSAESLTRLLAGFHPSDDRTLIEHQRGKAHRPGWDFTFSAPKSVSVLWSQADPATRQEIQDAHFAAVCAGLDYLEDTCAVARRGKGGVHHELAKLTFATFEHGTSRAQDPQLHTHCLLMNVGVRRDNTFGTLDSDPLFQAKMSGGSLYRAELAQQLEQRLGLAISRRGPFFEIQGVPPKICNAFSQRRAQITAVLPETWGAAAAAAASVTLSTRAVKGHASRADLFTTWGEVGRYHHWSQEQAQALLGRAPAREASPRNSFTRVQSSLLKSSILQVAQTRLTRQQSYFSERDFIRQVAEGCPGHGLGASEARQAIRQHLEINSLEKDAEVVRLGQYRGDTLYTTRTILAQEAKLLEQAQAAQERKGHTVSEATVAGVIRKRPFLSPQQQQALRHVTTADGDVKLVVGFAGTGKTSLLAAAREAWEQGGYRVIGGAVAGKAAQGLQDGAGIPSASLARLLNVWKSGPGTAGLGPAWQPSPARRRSVEWKYATWQISGKTRRLMLGEEQGPTPAMVEWKYATWQISGKTRRRMLGQDRSATHALVHEWKYATWQISKAHRNFLNAQLDRRRCELDTKTIVVIDEAGMVGTPQLARVIDAVTAAGAKLVLTGESKQIQPIESGAPFAEMTRRWKPAELTEILRQYEPWAREAVMDFAAGRTEKALQAYAERGLLHICEGMGRVYQELISHWKLGGLNKPEEQLIFTGTREEAATLNRLAQAERLKSGALSKQSLTVGGAQFHVGDRLLFTSNSNVYDVENGSLGTVTKISPWPASLSVRLDSGNLVKFRPSEYDDVLLGYAVTTHKGQGATVERAYVLAGGSMQDRELSYVQMSRARGDTHIFADRETAGEGMSRLVQQMRESRTKEIAHAVAARAVKEQAVAERAANEHTATKNEHTVPKSAAPRKTAHDLGRATDVKSDRGIEMDDGADFGF